MPVLLAPSIFAADFGMLREQLAVIEAGGADLIHVDVMDGHFVPNLTMGPVIVEAIRRNTRLPLDVHLMISDPDRYLQAFVDAGGSRLAVHIERCPTCTGRSKRSRSWAPRRAWRSTRRRRSRRLR